MHDQQALFAVWAVIGWIALGWGKMYMPNRSASPHTASPQPPHSLPQFTRSHCLMHPLCHSISVYLWAHTNTCRLLYTYPNCYTHGSVT